MKKIISDRTGQRLDNFLFQIYKATPNSHVYRMIRKGRIRINGRTCRDNTYKLQENDTVLMPVPINPEKLKPSDTLITKVKEMIVYEEADFWLLNKSPNICVHQSERDTFGIIEVLQHLFEEAHLIHRLDRNTSGCLLIAKNYPALLEFQKLWKAKQVQKSYLLLAQGVWQGKKTRTVNKPLLRVEKGGKLQSVVVSSKGKEATTHFHQVTQYHDCVLLRANIDTGRTHQIRVHAASIGHPIIGDGRYGRANNPYTAHIFLHANKLDFHWRGIHKVLTCDMSIEQRKCLEDLN